MIQPLAPQPTDTPDLSPLLRQRDLEDVLCGILEATFGSSNAVTHEGEDGRDYSLVVDKTTDGQVRATLYRHDGGIHWREVEVAQVRLDYTVTAVQA